ncbi:MAG: hypothetical protein NT141_01995 [candidate division WWE3 bacterium]|nr:hypothetical protein [candidate division WWE3 bacterium]
MIPAKIQKIGGNVAPNPKTGEIAFSNIEEPVDLPVLESRGSLYSVLDFSGISAQTAPLFGRLVWDTLKDSYYSEIEGTPLQALEKALTAVRGRLLGLSINPLPSMETAPNFELNLVAIVKWGQFLYTAVLGGGKIFLIRGMGVKEIVCDSSMEVSFASHPLDTDDIVMLTSKHLGNRLSFEKLLTTLGTLESELAISPNKAAELALIIKNTETLTKTGSNSGKKSLSNLIHRFSFKSKSNVNENPGLKKTKLLGIAVLVLGVVLVGSLALSLRDKQTVATSPATKVLGSSTDDLNAKISEITSNLSIDLPAAKAELTVAFTTLNNLSPEDKRKANFKTLSDSLTSLKIQAYNISALPSWREASMPATLGVVRAKFKDLTFNKKGSVTAYSDYVGFLYLVSPTDSQIYKATPLGKSFTVTPWLKNSSDVGKGLGIAVDGNVWVLDATSIKKFYKNDSTLFTISGIDAPFNNPLALYTDGDSDNLYVYDAGNSRLVAVNKTGLYKFQVALPKVPFTVRDLVVSETAKTFTVAGDTQALSGSFQ